MVDDTILESFKSVLRKEGLKVTPQRIVILEEIVKDKGHRESEEIYMAIKNRNSTVSRATIYRTLDLLVQNDFVRKLNLGDGRARYEKKFDSEHHDHMVCNRCGQIIEFVDFEIEKLQDLVAKKYKFILVSHIHQLFGICKECQ